MLAKFNKKYAGMFLVFLMGISVSSPASFALENTVVEKVEYNIELNVGEELPSSPTNEAEGVNNTKFHWTDEDGKDIKDGSIVEEGKTYYIKKIETQKKDGYVFNGRKRVVDDSLNIVNVPKEVAINGKDMKSSPDGEYDYKEGIKYVFKGKEKIGFQGKSAKIDKSDASIISTNTDSEIENIVPKDTISENTFTEPVKEKEELNNNVVETVKQDSSLEDVVEKVDSEHSSEDVSGIVNSQDIKEKSSNINENSLQETDVQIQDNTVSAPEKEKTTIQEVKESKTPVKENKSNLVLDAKSDEKKDMSTENEKTKTNEELKTQNSADKRPQKMQIIAQSLIKTLNGLRTVFKYSIK